MSNQAYPPMGARFRLKGSYAIAGSLRSVGVAGNVIEGNAIGINFNGSGVVADHNCIRDNNAAGSASGTGIYSDQGLLYAVIASNTFLDNTAAAVTVLGAILLVSTLMTGSS